jgi:hypothetical protein
MPRGSDRHQLLGLEEKMEKCCVRDGAKVAIRLEKNQGFKEKN